MEVTLEGIAWETRLEEVFSTARAPWQPCGTTYGRATMGAVEAPHQRMHRLDPEAMEA